MAMFAPMPSANDSVATVENPGLRRSVRSVYRTPWRDPPAIARVRRGPLLPLRDVPELQKRLPRGLGAVHAGGHVVVDQPIAVESELVANPRIAPPAEPHELLRGPKHA